MNNSDDVPDETPPAETGEQTTKRRACQKRMTEADIAQLNDLLKRPECRVDGKIHIATVCRLTGLTYNQVRKFISKDPYVEAQLGNVEPDKIVPQESELINPTNQPPAGVLMSPQDFAKAQALLRQQRKMVAKDWGALGMDASMAERMEKLSTMGGAPLLPVIQMLYGGLIKHVATLDEVLEGDAQRIKDDLLPAETDKEGMPVEDGKVQREWRYCWYAGYKLHLDLFNSMQKTQAMLARMMREMRDLGLNSKPPEKGVFEAPVAERKADDDAP